MPPPVLLLRTTEFPTCYPVLRATPTAMPRGLKTQHNGELTNVRARSNLVRSLITKAARRTHGKVAGRLGQERRKDDRGGNAGKFMNRSINRAPDEIDERASETEASEWAELARAAGTDGRTEEGGRKQA